MIPLITIEGATASGKSALAVCLAESIGAEIISADSRQVYRHMDIGTAKTLLQDRKGIPHHLIDIINPDQSYNAGSFSKDAAKLIEAMHKRKVIPIICGGTGLYVRSLLQGLCELPTIPEHIRNELKDKLNLEGISSLYKQLTELDPVFAAGISSNDRQRILRGLEVVLGTGKTLSEHWQNQRQNQLYRPFRIFLDPPRECLYEKINRRMEQMLSEGLLDEVKMLFSMGFDEHSPGLNSLGYKEFIPFVQGKSSAQGCSLIAAQHHRNYAKRQLTWYRKYRFDLTFNPEEIRISEIVKNVEASFTEASNANCSQSD